MGHAICADFRTIDCIAAAFSWPEGHIKCTAGQQKYICQADCGGIRALFGCNTDFHLGSRLHFLREAAIVSLTGTINGN